MVSIIVVSHSSDLAQAVIDLSMQMCQSKELKICGVGGSADNGFGTDSFKIARAIEKVYTEDGVVILVDLGSAIISTQLAIELSGLNPEKIKIADAPLVEGTVAAVTLASIGATFKEVISEAQLAREYHKK